MIVRTDRPAAGRPLDLALAQAMGWQIVVSPDGVVWTTGPVDAPIVAADGPLVLLPAWSTDEAAAWRIKLAVTALQVAVRALFGLAVVVTVVDPASPAWLRAVAVLGWVAHVVALIMSDTDPAADGVDERTPPAGQALHLALISPFGMLFFGVVAGLIMAVVQAMMHLVP